MAILIEPNNQPPIDLPPLRVRVALECMAHYRAVVYTAASMGRPDLPEEQALYRSALEVARLWLTGENHYGEPEAEDPAERAEAEAAGDCLGPTDRCAVCGIKFYNIAFSHSGTLYCAGCYQKIVAGE